MEEESMKEEKLWQKDQQQKEPWQKKSRTAEKDSLVDYG